MNLTGWTLDALRALEPSKLAQYLQAHGWQQQEQIADKASIWTKSASSGGAFEILLPLNTDAADFVRRMVEVIETLEVAEHRSQVEILNDLADVRQVAVLMEREVINFSLTFPSHYGSEAPILHLGTILKSLQDLVNGIGQSIALSQNGVLARFDNGTKLKKISPEFAREMELSAFGTFKGSFGIKLAASYDSLVSSSLMSDSLKELVELIGVGSETEGLKHHLFSLTSSSARRYVAFLKSLTNAGSGLNIDWGSPKSDYGGSAQMSLNTAKNALETIRNLATEKISTHRRYGKLTQGDVNTQHFKFEESDGSEYTGYIADEAMPYSGVLPLGVDCEVLMQETIVNYLVVDREDRLYTILELNFPGEMPVSQTPLFSNN